MVALEEPSYRDPHGSSISGFCIWGQLMFNPSMKKSIHSAEQQALDRLLRQIRLGKGLRQEDLARLLGKPQSFVSNYERGERRLDLLEIRQICEVVGISLSDFVRRFEESLQ